MNDSLCQDAYKNYTFIEGIKYCPAVFDNLLCWGPTEADSNTSQHCPSIKGIDSSKLVYRHCTDEGKWFNNNNSNLTEQGYTNYIICFNPSLRKVYNIVQRIGIVVYKIIDNTRYIEMVGLSLSLVTLLTSLIIFYTYRILRNNRTTIHKNLFTATLLQVVIRLVIYIDQYYEYQLEKVNVLCEFFVVLLEFSKMSSIMWMFIEGLYLHNAISFTVFQEHSYIKIYCYVGWIVPLILTAIWVITMSAFTLDKCWYLYNFLPNYWLIEGPSTFLIVVNLLFLSNIIRILVKKLRESQIGEMQQIWKAARAAIFLLPLMGSSNILFMVDYRVFNSSTSLAVWSYTTYFLTTFQGFFMATLYCFLNGEVREALRTRLAVYKFLMRYNTSSQRKHSAEDTGLTAIDTEP